MDKREEMRKIKEEVVAMGGTLADERRDNEVFPVLGEGGHDAEIMFIGEAPGKNEAASGRPFCGASGKILTKLVESIDLTRDEVYVTNVVKDRPPANRDPYPDEIALYGPFLERQIDVIRPKVVAALGRFSMDYVMRMMGLEHEIDSISKIHGKAFKIKAPWGDGGLYVVPLYHPAVAIYNRSKLGELEEDMQVLLTCLI